MKKTIYISVIFLASLIILNCSKDFLDRQPEDRLTDATYYQTDDEILMGTAPLYNVVWWYYLRNAMATIGDMRAGNMISNDRNMFYEFTVTEGRFEVLETWESFYSVIGQCNTLIYNIRKNSADEVTEEAKTYGIAEAKFMRGLAYSWLVLNWGPVPVIYDNIVQSSDTALARNTQESVWEFIIRDMEYAVENLPAAAPDDGRLTAGVAKGMCAKMYLYRSCFNSTGGVRNQDDLDRAAELAGDVCNSDEFSLMPNYYDLFLYENDNNEESMFALQWMAIDIDGIKNTFQAFYARNPDLTGTGDGWGAAHGCSSDLLQYYINHPEDSIRRKATFMFDWDHYPELCSSLRGFNQYDENGTGYTYQDTSIANVKKYIVGRPEDNDGEGVWMGTGNNTYMLRLAEVYLIYAEAILGNNASTNDPEALKFFNLVRSRAGVAELTELTLDDILQEKRIELAMEGNFWNELVHWYYIDPAATIDYINNQDKGPYYLKADTAVSPLTWTAIYPDMEINTQGDTSYPQRYFTVTAGDPNEPNPRASFWLPYPELEMTLAPNLRKPPVPFDFSVLNDEE